MRLGFGAKTAEFMRAFSQAAPTCVGFRRLPTDSMRLSLLAALAVLVSACATAPLAQSPDARTPASEPARPQNVVLMIADGFGPASTTLGAAAKGAPLALDSLLVGSVETSATDSRVTDSAASATAYACGIKTFNGAIAVDVDRQPCRTVLEAAEASGMATGLVATSRVTHATPASFGAHVEARGEEGEIARQLAASGVEVLFGGGAEYMTDAVLAAMRERGVQVATTRAGYDALAAAPAAAILADGHLAYEVDRDETDQPSLAEMTRKALDLLAASPDGQANGFFLMIEGSRIDHAAHGNDPVGHLGDILAYDEAVAAALDWAARDGATLVVSTADHETGGMTLGRDGAYVWDPAPLLAATASYEGMRTKMAAGEDPVEVVRQAVGLDVLPDGVAEGIQGAVAAQDSDAMRGILETLLSEPAGIGWTTGGHTAVDVGLYAYGPGAERFAGRMANDAVGRALFETLGLARD